MVCVICCGCLESDLQFGERTASKFAICCEIVLALEDLEGVLCAATKVAISNEFRVGASFVEQVLQFFDERSFGTSFQWKGFAAQFV